MFYRNLRCVSIKVCVFLILISQVAGCGDSSSKNSTDGSTGGLLEESIYDDGVIVDGQGRLIITQYRISWVFDKTYTYGQFVNGDYYVVDTGYGVKIVDISPGSQIYNGHDVYGSEMNPVAGIRNQGYDSQLGNYDENLNAGLTISSGNTLTLSAKDCIITSLSNTPPATHTYGGQNTTTKTCAILTVVGSAPSLGTFRPSYCDRSHSTLYNISDLDYDELSMLTPASGAPSISDVEAIFERVWVDNMRGWGAVYHHPLHMANYGREIASELGLAAVMLNTNLSNSQKETLLIRFVQIGIDLYGILVNGGQNNWFGEGGHGQGRKMPIIFAGIVLNDSNMMGIGAKSGAYLYSGGYGPGNPPPDYYNFGMDDQTFYVTVDDVTITSGASWNPDDRSGTAYPYDSGMIGMPEWGIRHSSYPEQCDSAWYTIYRQCCAATAWHSHILTAYIMSAKTLWNHDALFDYMDRYMAIANGDADPFGFTIQGEAPGWRSNNEWLEKMWDLHRESY